MIAEDEKILFISNARVIALGKTVLTGSSGTWCVKHWFCGEENCPDDTQVSYIWVAEQSGQINLVRSVGATRAEQGARTARTAWIRAQEKQAVDK
jgi:hypothetical protein